MQESLGVDFSFCIPFSNNIHPLLHSPTNSNGLEGLPIVYDRYTSPLLLRRPRGAVPNAPSGQ
ncbi:hypothetical protein KIN20_005207 [Parelaphostrongylus tenuis]|uniref:Uncharacterized protein n=1 Tax=Parelaphostrongylus tenuis TaxID=148309 RepID=A0AAD5M2W6_PARTN|nr:hypothetical protein KIN20_005207 [Parelaphostrongylus tenuis]